MRSSVPEGRGQVAAGVAAIISMALGCTTYGPVVSKVSDDVYLQSTTTFLVFSSSKLLRCREYQGQLFCQELPVRTGYSVSAPAPAQPPARPAGRPAAGQGDEEDEEEAASAAARRSGAPAGPETQKGKAAIPPGGPSGQQPDREEPQRR